MTHYQLIANNKFRSNLIMVGFVFFITVLVGIISYGFELDQSYIWLAFLGASATSITSYWWSDKIVLATSNARPANRQDFFDFYTTVENLALAQRTPLPKLYVIDDSAMNAFATGRDPEHAVICATTGLLSRLNRAEIEGVVSHELAHIQNYDIRLMTIVSVLVGMIALLSDWLLRSGALRSKNNRDDDTPAQYKAVLLIGGFILLLLSPLVAQLIQLALSRNREYLADASGAAMTKNPLGLAHALAKISSDAEPLEAANKATAHLYISDPLKNQTSAIGWFANLFQTHPPVAKRIAQLRAL